MRQAKPLGPMKSPPHPGELVREDVLKPLGLTVTTAAGILGISRSNLSLFLHERIDLSPEMALRLEAAFGLEAAMLMAMQADCDLSRVRTRQAEITAKVRRVWPASA
ncbi:MAG TPA: HigA family addiction module antitoxin [Geminicoccaceae bacterium]|nr:HigA family addiction module antitoxin [Geminicoccaceae bacterium]